MLLVLALHGLLLAATRFARVEPPRHDDVALAVALLGDPAPNREVQPRVAPPPLLLAPVPITRVDNAPAIEIPVAEAAPAASPAAHITAAAASVAGPQDLATELAVQCPERTPPRYPSLAKRQREQGEVRLKVELDEFGRIDRVTIVRSSGSPRLDEAARTAIESWRCRPAERDGRPVRAVALQSLAFVLERH